MDKSKNLKRKTGPNTENFIDELKWKLVGNLGKWLIEFICCTIRVEIIGFENVESLISSRKFIFAVWHSRLILTSHLYKGQDGTVLVSRSKDGEFAARILQSQGHKTVRGSSKKRGLRALLKLIKNLKENEKPGLIVPDGPTGPRFVVKPGIVLLAKGTGFPIIPITYSGKHIKIFSSWDRFILPLPFTKCRVVYGAPVSVPMDADRDIEVTCKKQLEKELCRITSDADRYFGHDIK